MRFIISLFVLSVFAGDSLYAQDADYIIARHVEAIGGTETWHKKNDMTMEMTLTMPGVSLSTTLKSMRPNLNYSKAYIAAMAIDIIEGYDGEVAWQINPMQGGKMKKSPEQTEQISQKTFGSIFIDFKKKGHTVEYLETVSTDGKACYKLLVTKTDGRRLTYFIDTETYYLIREETAMPVTPENKAGKAILVYSDYRKVDGVTMAFNIRADYGQVKQDAEVSSIVFNTGLKKSDFSMPE